MEATESDVACHQKDQQFEALILDGELQGSVSDAPVRLEIDIGPCPHVPLWRLKRSGWRPAMAGRICIPVMCIGDEEREDPFISQYYIVGLKW